MSTNYTPKFLFEISEEQKNRADRLLKIHGLRRAIFSRILDNVLDLIEEHGDMVIGALLLKDVKPEEILKPLTKARKIGEKHGKAK